MQLLEIGLFPRPDLEEYSYGKWQGHMIPRSSSACQSLSQGQGHARDQCRGSRLIELIFWWGGRPRKKGTNNEAIKLGKGQAGSSQRMRGNGRACFKWTTQGGFRRRWPLGPKW